MILPGDVRELLNKVVEAERVAKANLIRRQEETAATRSLLNTARLMEDNPLLLRLKELEALEKLVEKVGRIDLHTGGRRGGFDALLQNLYRLRAEADGAKPSEAKPAWAGTSRYRAPALDQRCRESGGQLTNRCSLRADRRQRPADLPSADPVRGEVG